MSKKGTFSLDIYQFSTFQRIMNTPTHVITQVQLSASEDVKGHPGVFNQLTAVVCG